MLDPGFLERINDMMVCLTCAILCHTLRAWRTGVFQGPPDFKWDVVRGKSLGFSWRFVLDIEGQPISHDLFLRQRDT